MDLFCRSHQQKKKNGGKDDHVVVEELSVKQAKIIKPQSIISRYQTRRISKIAQIDGKKDADDRECMQEDSRMYETMDFWDRVASGP